MSKLRRVIFWSHLSVALLVGLVVAIKAVTGIALAFEPQILERVEADSLRVVPGPRALSVDEVLARVRAKESRPIAALVVSADPTAAVRVSAGRDGGFHVDPYTGEVRPLAGQGWRGFLDLMERWHRWLGMGEELRAAGKAISGAATLGILFLTLSGLYLWWPRVWTRRALGRSLWFRRGLEGRARDWSWHNVIGFWCLPALVVLTASGVVLSYRWASNLVFTLAGEPPPGETRPPAISPSGEDARPLPLEELVVIARREVPGWRTITVRTREGGRRGERGRSGAQAVLLSVKQGGAWPRFASTQLSLDPFTGAVLRKEAHGEQSAGRRARSWLRFLHTGEALGWPGQLVAALACLGAVFSIGTGWSLAWRRLRRRTTAASGTPR